MPRVDPGRRHGHRVLAPTSGPELRSALWWRSARRWASAWVPKLPVGTYFRGANTTQFGGKSSIAIRRPVSGKHRQAGGAAGLVISAALQHGITLRPTAQGDPGTDRRTGDRFRPQPAQQPGAGDGPRRRPGGSLEDQWTSHSAGARQPGRGGQGRARSCRDSARGNASIPRLVRADQPDSIELTDLARARAATEPVSAGASNGSAGQRRPPGTKSLPGPAAARESPTRQSRHERGAGCHGELRRTG